MTEEKKKLNCGIIMPISSIDGCSSEHWGEVQSIIEQSVNSIEEYNFNTKLVSDADEISVIHKRIVQNIYFSDIIICDVSAKNPNVMFELGMRLAFDKPVVIIKDDETEYSFDTGIIEHLEYPRDLRFAKIVKFKKLLAEKIMKTYKNSVDNSDHSPFLKNFGEFKIANINEQEVSANEVILDMLSDLQNEMINLRSHININRNRDAHGVVGVSKIIETSEMIEALNKYLSKNNIDNKDFNVEKLIGNNEFYKFVQEEIGAEKYFNSRNEFNRNLTELIKEIKKIN